MADETASFPTRCKLITSHGSQFPQLQFLNVHNKSATPQMVERTPMWTSPGADTDIFGIRVSPDDMWIGCALSNGQVSLHSYKTGRLSYTLEHSPDHFATTSLRFNKRLPKTFIAVSSDGVIRQWGTHKCTVQWTVAETGNQIFALDMSPECDKFATAGLDKKVRIYDYEKREVATTLERTAEFGDDGPGHTNRIFSVLFRDQNTLFSAGWDDTIQMWDLRMGKGVRSMFGSHVCSDTLDVCGNYLLSGSWRTSNQIQIWDLRSYREERVLNWQAERQCLVYTAKFHPSGEFVVAGGSGANEVRFLNVKTGNTMGSPLTFESTVYAVCFSNDAKQLIVGTQKGGLQCFKLKK